jgi:hypothetical protein
VSPGLADPALPLRCFAQLRGDRVRRPLGGTFDGGRAGRFAGRLDRAAYDQADRVGGGGENRHWQDHARQLATTGSKVAAA